MFPVSTHKGQAVMAFPDVCKTPVPIAGPTPIPYPTMSTTSTLSATKPTLATKPTATKTSGDEATGLRNSLSLLHQKLMTMRGGDTTAWHAAVDDYVMTSAALYKALSTR